MVCRYPFLLSDLNSDIELFPKLQFLEQFLENKKEYIDMKYSEMSKLKLKIIPAFAIAAVLVFSGCTGLVEKTGKVVDGSAFAEKTTALYRTQKESAKKKSSKKNAGNIENAIFEIKEVQNKSGIQSLVISMEAFPCLLIRGSAPDGEGKFYFTSIDYLGGSLSGWNEFSMDMAGAGIFRHEADTARFYITSPLDQVEISIGRILHNDTRIIGNEALNFLRNRRERISALVSWMKDYNLQKGNAEFVTIAEFEKYFKPILLPELCSKKKRPLDYSKKNVHWKTAFDVKWNCSYSDILFSENDSSAQTDYSVEELENLRNTGAIMRDWEEALDWIWMQYNWERITEILQIQTTVYKIK